jgi:metal-sulfur cluster biosynthetic enzyme
VGAAIARFGNVIGKITIVMNENTEALEQAIIEQLQKVIDPETGADVWRMRLVENLTVDENGHVDYRFRPSSPLCPIAIPLAQMIKRAVRQVTGVASQSIEVTNYVQASLLTELLNLEV